MTTCIFQNLLKLENQIALPNQFLENSKPFSYHLLCKEKDKLWDFFYLTEFGEICCHRIKCYKFGKLIIYKNGGHFLSRTLEGLMSHLIGHPLSSCFQIRLCL